MKEPNKNIKREETIETIYIELSNEKHHKFYELILENKTVTATFGRIGYTGNTKIYKFDTNIEAKIFLETQKTKKIHKGYELSIKGLRLPRPKHIHYKQLQIQFIL